MKTILFSLIISIITTSLHHYITASLIAPALASESPVVTIHSCVRAEADFQMQTYVEKFDCFGKFLHVPGASDVSLSESEISERRALE